MKLIIDVPEEVYEALKGITEDSTSLDPYSLADIIVNKSEVIEELKPQGDLISREALKKAFENLASDDYNEPIWYQQTVFETINNAPTVPLPDFKEGYKQAIIDGKTNFSRLQGKWITRTEDNGINYRFYCSCCDREVMLITEYCPYCGADNMKKGGAK